ncbi:hypothetical protein DM02DRAFT_510929 [Periconia macrospinosa]|uniref:C2H2-type domain-containing protein n=1 Tax=Periconia macrospinosa TaxID=97972 RepID=A0A2V1EBQ1_9PLEO|nr:hypothetical protein DM02DRAFT_510929 [Periconia macrospinosa]
MTYVCNICTKRFNTRGGLKNHTGTNTTSARKPHPCDRCAQIFCSEQSLRSHQNAPSHATMFGCSLCNRKFGSKQAHRQHMGSESHARKHKETPSSIAPAAKVDTRSRVLGDWQSSKECTYDHDYTSDQYSNDESSREAWLYTSPTDWEDDQDWALCDKECGWCGHCADGVSY